MSDRQILVTGGCGFIGSNFIRHLLTHRPGWRIVNLDALTYAGNLGNLRDVADSPNYTMIKGNICDEAAVQEALAVAAGPVDSIVNFAAESHVDRSVLGPKAFVQTNFVGTFTLLEAARKLERVRFLQVSTDEVYGSLGDDGAFTESTSLDPSSPYSASKTAADHLVLSYCRTFGLDAVVTRCSNNYGPYQFPEKLIPLMIINALKGKPLPVYGTGKNVRDWIHVDDHCRGILMTLEDGEQGEAYNFGGEAERNNLEIVEQIADEVAGNRDLITFVRDRPGHDWRYAMDISKARKRLGFAPTISFERGLKDTVKWYVENQSWWQPILSGEYQQYYRQWYGNR